MKFVLNGILNYLVVPLPTQGLGGEKMVQKPTNMMSAGVNESGCTR